MSGTLFRALLPVGLIGLACVVGCSAGSGSGPSQPCGDIGVQRFKELILVDAGVVGDARALNAGDGPWSFRHAVEAMAPPGVDPADFVRDWLTGWVAVHEVNGFPLDRPNEGRDAAMTTRVLCPWQRRSPQNGCNDDCSKCSTTKLDLATAPFRLVAIVNRLDLRENDLTEPSGEGRLVFGLTDGAADDPGSPPMPMTINFEYVLPETRSVTDWARAWHALGQMPAYDESFKAALQQITDGFTARGARPGGPNGGSSIGQIRTNESVLDWIWQLREFAIDETGALRLRPLHNTPAQALNGSGTLSDWVKANADAIFQNRYELPVAMRSASADQLQYAWTVPGVDEKLRRAFAANTCNGCHSGENPSVDTAFHVSPLRNGLARVSPFLNAPDGSYDELSRRTESVQRALCGK
jgi:hypothetical protein